MANQWNQGNFGAPPAQKSAFGWKSCLLGCVGIILVVGAACSVLMFFGWRYASAAVNTIQAQATALGQNNAAEVCRHNSPTLQAALPCPAYIQWFQQNAPYFAGGRVAIAGFNGQSTGGASQVTLPVQVNGPRGSGRLTFYLRQSGETWQIERVEPN